VGHQKIYCIRDCDNCDYFRFQVKEGIPEVWQGSQASRLKNNHCRRGHFPKRRPGCDRRRSGDGLWGYGSNGCFYHAGPFDVGLWSRLSVI
jgi:hypothetical protein